MAGGIAFAVEAWIVTFKDKLKPMKTRIILCVLIFVLFTSCMRALTPDQAANGSYKHCHPMK